MSEIRLVTANKNLLRRLCCSCGYERIKLVRLLCDENDVTLRSR